MTCKPFIAAVLLLASFGGLQARAGTTDNNQNIAIDSDLKIPGYVLKPGIYTLAVEDQFKGRWVVAISGADKHYSLLAVPTGKLGSEVSKGIVLFTSADSRKQILRGWVCPKCEKGLEFVYPKEDAVKITDNTGQRVLAVDTAYDKLPRELTAADMKLATLWLLSPKRMTGAHRGVGVKAVRYAYGEKRRKAVPVELAAAGPKMLPKTATNTVTLAAMGMALWMLALGVHARRMGLILVRTAK